MVCVGAGIWARSCSGLSIPTVREDNMPQEYEINKLAKEESWRMFRIIGKLGEGFDTLADVEAAVSIYGSVRIA